MFAIFIVFALYSVCTGQATEQFDQFEKVKGFDVSHEGSSDAWKQDHAGFDAHPDYSDKYAEHSFSSSADNSEQKFKFPTYNTALGHLYGKNYQTSAQLTQGSGYGYRPAEKVEYYPIPYAVHVPVPKLVVVPVAVPYHVRVEIPHPVAVPVIKNITIPVEKPVPFPVEKLVRRPYEKLVPMKVEVPMRYYYKVPVYKHYFKEQINMKN